MSWVAVGVGVAGAVAGAYGANKQAGAAQAAGAAGAAASADANATQLAMFNQQRNDQMSFMRNGLTAQNQFMQLLGLQGYSMTPPPNTAEFAQKYLQDNPDVANDPYWGQHAWEHYTQHGQSEGRVWGTQQPQGQGANTQTQQQAFDVFRNAPGYQFGLQEGQRAVNTSANAQGGLFSGKAGKALVKFGTDYADQQGFTPYMNRLAAVAGMGQTATSQAGAAGQNYANQYGANVQNAANARASGIIGSANAWSNYGNQLAGYAGMAAGAYQRRSNP